MENIFGSAANNEGHNKINGSDKPFSKVSSIKLDGHPMHIP